MVQETLEVVRAEGVGKVYNDRSVPVQALKDVTLTVSAGAFIVLAGPSGSGKTTLLNILGALDAPSEGKVFLQGEDLSGKSRNALARLRLHRIGFIFQAYNLNPVLSAFENVEFPLVLQDVPSRKRHSMVEGLLRELDIAHLADTRPNNMSGGQQQRVAAARAIVTTPLLVLADEPTANLDSVTAAKLLDLMEDINQSRGITFLFSSHDPQVIERARRLVRLRDGRMESDETVR